MTIVEDLGIHDDDDMYVNIMGLKEHIMSSFQRESFFADPFPYLHHHKPIQDPCNTNGEVGIFNILQGRCIHNYIKNFTRREMIIGESFLIGAVTSQPSRKEPRTEEIVRLLLCCSSPFHRN